jgi:hypothetical protein
MAETPKRLKKNISFSDHEKDIYDYLGRQKNASALIKRLVLQHMIMEKGGVAPKVEKTTNKQDEKIETGKDTLQEMQQQNENPVIETKFTDEDIENKNLIPDL